mgnify:CR=1 FL=1
MKLVYDQNYWNDYYGGSYATTFQYGYPLESILASCWDRVFTDRPKSFADIGSGPGHTLVVAQSLLPNADLYGVEVQDIPTKDLAHDKVIIGDFLEMSKDLKPVDLLYCSCSMYVPWEDQPYFISEVLRLAKKAACFPNVYLTDGQGIPEDMHRKVIYRDKETFAKGIESVGGWKRLVGKYDFFHRNTPPVLAGAVGKFSGEERTTYASPKRPGEQYKLHAELDMAGEIVINVSYKGMPVAMFEFEKRGRKLRPLMSDVDPDHQRMGLASKVYDWAEELTGLTLVPSLDQSEEAREFWKKRKGQSQP